MAFTSNVLERLLQPTEGDMPPEYARRWLAFEFTEADQARSQELSQKAQLGTLTEDERGELEELVTANDVLMILRAKAQLSLNPPPPARS
jgi:hypothetical protein